MFSKLGDDFLKRIVQASENVEMIIDSFALSERLTIAIDLEILQGKVLEEAQYLLKAGDTHQQAEGV
jgi:hypothetical protein